MCGISTPFQAKVDRMSEYLSKYFDPLGVINNKDELRRFQIDWKFDKNNILFWRYLYNTALFYL